MLTVYLLVRVFANVRSRGFVDEAAQPESKVVGVGLHGLGELLAQSGQRFLVHAHGGREVHQVVQVHRIVPGPFELKLDFVHVVLP